MQFKKAQTPTRITKFRNKDRLPTEVFTRVFFTEWCKGYSGIQVNKSRCKDIAFRWKVIQKKALQDHFSAGLVPHSSSLCGSTNASVRTKKVTRHKVYICVCINTYIYMHIKVPHTVKSYQWNFLFRLIFYICD